MKSRDLASWRPGGRRPLGQLKLLNRKRERHVADSVIRDPEEHTVMDERGAVRSIQAADLSMPTHELDAIWSPMHLERLARTYWKYLSRVTLGLIRVAYTPTERLVVLVTKPLVLLRFYAPEYEMDDDRGVVRWRIRDGLLVASEGREGDGYLEIEVDRCPEPAPGRSRMHVEVEIASFYPDARPAPPALAVRQHAVAHPRARHARVPALAGAARARGVGGRPLRHAGTRRRAGFGQRRGPGAQRRRDGRAIRPGP